MWSVHFSKPAPEPPTSFLRLPEVRVTQPVHLYSLPTRTIPESAIRIREDRDSNGSPKASPVPTTSPKWHQQNRNSPCSSTPLVPEAVQHNNRVLSSLHSLTAFLLGLSAGILALQSTAGFAFYFAGTVLVSGLFHLVLLSRSGGAGAGAFFPGAGGEIDGSVVMTRSGVVKMDLGLGGKGGLHS
ncbi:Transmembrane protein 93 [Penicillium atrosanguineum]|nr:Transmembrane protein 93 [Penicillium atrosanguineum]KAJ5139576.1 Transmembrane protein 93 [Penicillium atrosanguineum]